MKVYQTNEIRNIALIGNSGSGKTTLAEAIRITSYNVCYTKLLRSQHSPKWQLHRPARPYHYHQPINDRCEPLFVLQYAPEDSRYRP